MSEPAGGSAAGAGAPAAPPGFLVVVSAITVTGILATTLVAPALPDLARDLDLSPGATGAVLAAGSLPGFLAAPLIGVLADRFGRRNVVVPCLVVFGLAGLAAAAAPSFGLLFALRFVQGCGGAGLVNLAVVMLGDRYAGPALAARIGRNAAILTAGLAVMPVVGGILTAIGGWRLAFVPYGGALAVAVAARAVLPGDRPGSVVSPADQLRSAGPWLRDRRLVMMMLGGSTVFLLMFGLGLTVLPLDLDERFGLGPAGRGIVLGTPALASIAVSLRMGWLNARFGTWPLVRLGFVLVGVAFAMIAGSPVVIAVLLAALVWGVGEALTIVGLQTSAAELAPPEHRGVVVAAFVAAARAGQAAGPIGAGALVGVTGTRGALVAGAGLAILAAVAFALARPERPPTRRSVAR